MIFGIVGAGRWAEVHRDAVRQTGNRVDCVLVSSRSSAERVEAEWGVRATTDPRAFLGYGSEAVIVASPNHLHAAHTTLCLDAGKHVLVEKPMALTVEDCDRMISAASRSGKLLAVGLEMRVFTLFEKVKELLDGGEIGRPLHLRLDLWRRPYRAGAGGWKADPAKVGSSILEEPVHYLDLARYYLAPLWGEPQRVSAWATSRPGSEGRWQTLDVRLSFGGAEALLTRSIAAYGHTVTLQLVGETGSLRAEWRGAQDLDPEPAQHLWLHGGDRDAPPEELAVPVGGHAFDLPRQTRAFVDALRRGGPPPASGEDGRASVALCLAVEAALRTEGPVSPWPRAERPS